MLSKLNRFMLQAGATQLLQAMAFKGTKNRTHFATVRQVGVMKDMR
jgi:predicted Zn-dependent peptidase